MVNVVNVILGIVSLLIMGSFAIGAAVLASEEKEQRYSR